MLAIRLLGFGLWVSWLWMLFLEGPLLGPTAERWHYEAGSFFMLFMFGNSGGLLYLGLGLRPRSLATGGIILPVSIGLMCLSPLLLAFIPCLAPSHMRWAVPILTLLAAFGSSVLGGSWLESFSRMRLGDTAIVFAGGAVIAGISTIAAAHVDYFIGMGAVSVMAVASYLLLKKQRISDGRQDDCRQAVNTAANPFPVKLIILFALFYIAGGLMFKIVSLEQTYPYLFYLANGSYALICLIAGLTLYYKPTIDLRFLYRPVLPFLGVGFILFVANVNVALLAFLLLQAGFALFDMYTWLLIAYMARFHDRPAAVCCLGQFLITFSIFCGNLVFSLWTGLAGETSTDSLAMIAGVLCLLAALVFSDNRETFSGWEISVSEAVTVAGCEDIGSALPTDVITDRSGDSGAFEFSLLTMREKEVLQLLLKGRSNNFIGEALNISVNTVKYHVRNLYEKLQVTNRQELLDAVEKMNGK